MKKFVFLIGASFTLLSCEKEVVLNSDLQTKTETSLLDDETEFEQSGLRFKHGVGCNYPLGLCVGIPIGKLITSSSDALKSNEMVSEQDDMGIVRMRMEGKNMHIIFDRQAALPNGMVPIDRDILLEGWKNKKNAVIKAGNYNTNFEKSKYGEIWADAYTFE